MILSDNEILHLMKNKELEIENFEDFLLQPASVDVRLANTFCIPVDTTDNILHLDRGVDYKVIYSDRYLLLPGQFVLGSTKERFKLPNNLTAFVEGRSTYGRLGLFIQNAGWVDPGFCGDITLELYNANKYAIELIAGKRIGQLVFAKMGSDATNPYGGKYQFQEGATGSKVHLDTN